MTRADRLAIAWAALTGLATLAAGPSLGAVALPTALAALLVLDGVARPGSGVLVPTVTRGPRAGRHVALTFDCGPDPEHTPPILEALEAAGAHATFFCIGERLEAHPELARRMAEGGHEVANHSHTRPRALALRGLSRTELEVARGAAAVRGATGRSVEPLYRPPLGLKGPALARVARQRGLQVVTWSLDGRDGDRADAREVAERILDRVRIGDIVRLRDGGRDRAATVEAVPLILEGLASRGLRCVTVSELVSGDG